MSTIPLNPHYRYIAFIGTALLFILCVLWEWILSPVEPGGTLLVLKALPLLFPLYGLWRGSLYTMQWTSMMILLYLMEGVVRWMSDTTTLSQQLALVETLLAMIVFFATIMYVRPAKRVAKQRKRAGQ
ncbi:MULTISPECIES: DUF2069 domain-containing protein [Oligella]|uniref:DUF2069 domain-containing protein n=2 Tax=Oligella urethralis TaxID=90245 RepID=A0A096BF83_9BURK|nr:MULTISPECIES: DUF2069 domain-containing protein [Oligella]KGF31799.1 hypothetical protein HMPREF2130_01960 [Oligella urethralis DNF00040]MDK6202071.1 DUF2069 domain-containing protein [Oligella urethralis]OFS86279.1 hypothetical protein HMPREF3144_04575 [Oligella sp. HMSC05A10]OFV51484.1 hypothetical protein HMPREF3179_00210 [Oligella sp. HMSC09E12]PMC17803.1 DUF2069 domain-containing protein [Oligella urethralis]